MVRKRPVQPDDDKLDRPKLDHEQSAPSAPVPGGAAASAGDGDGLPEGPRANLGSLVAYVSRDAWIHASETGLPAEPLVGIVSVVHINKEDRKPTGAVTIHVFDPESPTGIRVERAVPIFDGSGPGYRVLPVRIDLQAFSALIDSRIEHVLAAPAQEKNGEDS